MAIADDFAAIARAMAANHENEPAEGAVSRFFALDLDRPMTERDIASIAAWLQARRSKSQNATYSAVGN
jgi:hypothetical protein